MLEKRSNTFSMRFPVSVGIVKRLDSARLRSDGFGPPDFAIEQSFR